MLLLRTGHESGCLSTGTAMAKPGLCETLDFVPRLYFHMALPDNSVLQEGLLALFGTVQRAWVLITWGHWRVHMKPREHRVFSLSWWQRKPRTKAGHSLMEGALDTGCWRLFVKMSHLAGGETQSRDRDETEWTQGHLMSKEHHKDSFPGHLPQAQAVIVCVPRPSPFPPTPAHMRGCVSAGVLYTLK